jgi:carbamoyltransferase
MIALLGVAGATRNACAAVCLDGRIAAACQQERITRVRGIGLQHRLPKEAVDEVLSLARRCRDDVTTYVMAEPKPQLPSDVPSVVLDHHHGHAATSFLTSPFASATVVVCDSSADRQVSVWSAVNGHLQDLQWRWRGHAFAILYSQCAALFEFERPSPEQQLEALAHLGGTRRLNRVRQLFEYEDGTLTCHRGWRDEVHDLIEAERCRGEGLPIDIASALQQRIGELLLEFLDDVCARSDCDTLCLGGGLFYNTYFTTLVRKAAAFRDVFVPIDPGNPGLAVGATLAVSAADKRQPDSSPLSPFLGPEYDSDAIKSTLDGCKLSYSFVSESQALDETVHALRRGYLVGWFQGRMEWGHKALGNRSILADPTSPYVLDNLNCFLRKRERWRPFGVSALAEGIPSWFCGPATSDFMQFEYGVRDERLRHVMPEGATTLRVQTVAPSLGSFWALHKRMEQAAGAGVLVNTSLNGFHEPIACTPRDAIRVFYGTGLDMLVLGRFILRK